MKWKTGLAVAAAMAAILPGMAAAQTASFRDPAGDDKGPGTYTYPTDMAYKPGSFDLTGLDVSLIGEKVEFAATMRSTLEDPWRMGVGFSVQMLMVFVRTGTGRHVDAPPGLNVKFAAPGWDKVIILSPQTPARVRAEVAAKAGLLASDIIVPERTKGAGNRISAAVPRAALGGGSPRDWSYQVVVLGNEGFPSGRDLLTRRVNEYNGQHRFGGGTDSDCDPNVMDILAGLAVGGSSEVAAQRAALSYECEVDGSTLKMATLPMLRP
ncbi:glucodextranase DOMON-like domain-containing protein [Sphingomonas canadensis]|uniref:Glucodextranase DOMON-like domain-containing protein n=1 Tax=Sphingomonas canadensis TaxID=1219257 RepID=A0ABW3H5F4_9SPHN|nr:glucodextranase DOMON-like domain-containing protein [Sphingomonas canadensis]MCW3836498.1 hypothetical protein [Sphingomonas canadensis]